MHGNGRRSPPIGLNVVMAAAAAAVAGQRPPPVGQGAAAAAVAAAAAAAAANRQYSVAAAAAAMRDADLARIKAQCMAKDMADVGGVPLLGRDILSFGTCSDPHLVHPCLPFLVVDSSKTTKQTLFCVTHAPIVSCTDSAASQSCQSMKCCTEATKDSIIPALRAHHSIDGSCQRRRQMCFLH